MIKEKNTKDLILLSGIILMSQTLDDILRGERENLYDSHTAHAFGKGYDLNSETYDLKDYSMEEIQNILRDGYVHINGISDEYGFTPHESQYLNENGDIIIHNHYVSEEEIMLSENIKEWAERVLSPFFIEENISFFKDLARDDAKEDLKKCMNIRDEIVTKLNQEGIELDFDNVEIER